jgi:hypothetical protein
MRSRDQPDHREKVEFRDVWHVDWSGRAHISGGCRVSVFVPASQIRGEKNVGELAPFDLLVLLILSETVQNAMIWDDKSLVGGLISAGTLIALVQMMGYLSWRSKKMQRLLEGKPRILVRHGRRRKEMMRQRVSVSELTEALRRQGCTDIANVRVAILETMEISRSWSDETNEGARNLRRGSRSFERRALMANAGVRGRPIAPIVLSGRRHR